MNITFYVLKNTDKKLFYHFVCQTIEKIYHTGQKIFIWTEDENETHLLDELLWTFKNESFIPHGMNIQDNNAYLKILINHELSQQLSSFDVWINLSVLLPSHFSMSSSLIEMVDGNEERQEIFRKKYRQYKQLGYELKTEKIE